MRQVRCGFWEIVLVQNLFIQVIGVDTASVFNICYVSLTNDGKNYFFSTDTQIKRQIIRKSIHVSRQTSIQLVQWASYQIHKIAGCACAGNAGNEFPRRRFKRKPLVSDPGMHHGTCVTHVPWCMSGSLTCGDGENVPGIPGACAPAILRIWQEAHGKGLWLSVAGLYRVIEMADNSDIGFVIKSDK